MVNIKWCQGIGKLYARYMQAICKLYVGYMKSVARVGIGYGKVERLKMKVGKNGSVSYAVDRP